MGVCVAIRKSLVICCVRVGGNSICEGVAIRNGVDGKNSGVKRLGWGEGEDANAPPELRRLAWFVWWADFCVSCI